jgi:hypothetical protein
MMSTMGIKVAAGLQLLACARRLCCVRIHKLKCVQPARIPVTEVMVPAGTPARRSIHFQALLFSEGCFLARAYSEELRIQGPA